MQKEKQNPLQYLCLNDFRLIPNSCNLNIDSEKKTTNFKILGKIQNKTENTFYKNIEIEVSFFSKNNKITQCQVFSLNEPLPPNQSNKIEIVLGKYDEKKFNHFMAKVINAGIF